ncbi:MAG: hypothetical protein ACUVUD_01810 [bacterium]
MVSKILISLTLSLLFLIMYFLLPSTRYNTDGFRVLSTLHRITIDPPGVTNFSPLNWKTSYQPPYYFRQNVQKHFLFPLYAHTTYNISRLAGLKDSGIKPLQFANALFATLTILLFTLLLAVQSHPLPNIILSTLGLGFSAAFATQATNIAEVIFSTPSLVLTLIFLEKRKPFIASILLGISAACYLLSLLLVPFLILFYSLHPRRRLFPLLTVTPGITLLIYLTLLIAAGNHTLQTITNALFYLPEQGTFGGFKLSNLISTPLGFISSILPVLPENFSGVKNALSLKNPHPVLLIILIAVGILLLAIITYISRKQCPKSIGIALLLTSILAALIWDPYHQKIWLYGNIGVWLFLANSRPSCPLLIIIVLFLIPMNLSLLVKNHRPNPKWHSAKKIAQVISFEQNPAEKKIVLGNWEPEFDYLSAFLPDSCLLSIPDLILETKRDSLQFQSVLDSIQHNYQTGGIYIVNTFNRSREELKRLYINRLKFPYFIGWQKTVRQLTRPLWHDTATGTILYTLQP